MANLVGQTLLRQFRVDSFVASGGMGSVYRVWDLNRNVPLAMKVLHAELAEDPSVYKKFEREANALKKLAHPHIVPFYGLYKTLDFAFLLERFIDGPSLKEIIKKKLGAPMPVEEALIYLKALSSALGYAHSKGVVHCDVKPGNVMIDQGGSIYLTDFGVARHSDSTTTTIGSAGTPAYMPPEQILGDPVTPATDVYALGVMFFEMLTGQRPFRGKESGTEKSGATLHERIRFAHLNTPAPDPRTIIPSIPKALAETILKSLSKSASNRYSNALEFFEAICVAVGANPERIREHAVLKDSLSANSINQQINISAPAGVFASAPSSSVRDNQVVRPRTLIGIAVVSVTFCAFLGVCGLLGRPIISSFSTPSPVVFLDPTEIPQLATPFLEVTQPLETPSSDVLITLDKLSVITTNNVDLIQKLFSWEDGGEIICLSVSSDGNLVASGSRAGRIKVWQVWKQELIFELDGQYATFSPDGNLLGVASESGAYLFDASTGSLIRPLNEERPFYSIMFSPDGKLIVAGTTFGNFYVWNVRDGSIREFGANLGGNVNQLSFSRDSKLVALSSIDKTYVWDLNENKIARSINITGKQKVNYYSTVLSDTGELFATGLDGKIILWRISNAEKILTMTRGDKPVISLQFLESKGDNSLLASGDYDGLSFWTIRGYNFSHQLIEFPDILSTFSVDSNKKFIVASDENGMIYLYGISP